MSAFVRGAKEGMPVHGFAGAADLVLICWQALAQPGRCPDRIAETTASLFIVFPAD
jgi:hypothetical protein